mgnify:CR=1 FL=1|jgi:cytoskeletal protein RodZ
MKFCVYCGHALPENTKFCTNCGKEQIQRNVIQEDDAWMYDEEDAVEYNKKSKNGTTFKIVIVVIVLVLAAGILWRTGVFQKNTEKELVATIKSNQEEVLSDSEEEATTTKKKTDASTSDTTVQNKQKTVQQDNNTTQADQNQAVAANEYILPTDTQYISESDLQGMTQEQVALARNEVYARHGYIFQNEDYQSYFSSKSWYKPDATYQPTDDTLSKIEKANVDLIVKYEVSKGWRAS